MSKIKYHEIKSMQSIQKHKNSLRRTISQQESDLLEEWETIKNPFKKYFPIAQSAAKTLTLIPVLIDSFTVGKKICSLFLNRNKREK